MTPMTCFITGTTGLLGGEVVARLVSEPGVGTIHALTRSPIIGGSQRIVPVGGNMLSDGLGIARPVRNRLAREVTTVVHCAATTAFSQPLDVARATNTEGTRRLLEVTADWPHVRRWVFVSTAFVAGLRTGVIDEADIATSDWANGYEQSKAEAEALVRDARDDWAIARPATVVCDDATGRISQVNAVHRALRLYFSGLAAMLPTAEHSRLDVVTTEYAARGIARLVMARDVERRAFHFCAGNGAMPLGQLLDATYESFLRAPAWRRKGIARPVRTDLETYRMFEAAVEDAGSERVRQAVRSLGHFVPQLAYPKHFDTTGADALLGEAAPDVASYWEQMVDTLIAAPAAREVA